MIRQLDDAAFLGALVQAARRVLAGVAVALAVSSGAPALATPMFVRLGTLTDEHSSSTAVRVSADGMTVVGYSGPSTEAFRWTRDTGMVGLGNVGYAHSLASAVSADGSTVVGYRGSPGSNEAFRWTSAGGMVGLGDLPGGGLQSIASDVSADGSTVVGYSWGASGNQAFLWTSGGGMVGLDPPAFTTGARGATGISAAGATIVGEAFVSGATRAFVWTDATGARLLALPDGEYSSSAAAVSADGLKIVGAIIRGSELEASLWTSGGYVAHGSLGGEYGSFATALSADGSIVVGIDDAANGPVPFLWTQGGGMRSLQEVLVDDYGLGLSLAGWTLRGVDISDDGRTMVGWGSNADRTNEAWMVVIPEPRAALLLSFGVAGTWALKTRQSAPRSPPSAGECARRKAASPAGSLELSRFRGRLSATEGR